MQLIIIEWKQGRFKGKQVYTHGQVRYATFERYRQTKPTLDKNENKVLNFKAKGHKV